MQLPISPIWVFPWDQIADIGVHLSRYLKLFDHKRIFEVFQPVRSQRQTDRH